MADDRFGRRTAVLLALAFMTAAMWMASAGAAAAASLREIAPRARAFASDGSRYAAWQENAGSPITVLDTASGRRASVTAPSACTLQSQEEFDEARPSASAGHFLLDCDVSEQGVLDAATGDTQSLSDDLGKYTWSEVGSLYAESPDTGCLGYNECLALYELASGTVSIRHSSGPVDLSRAGAPSAAICAALWGRVSALEKAANPPPFAYDDGLLAHAAKRAGYVEVDRCKRPAIVLPGRGAPRDFELRAGTLTWDTGYPGAGVDEEEESRYPSRLMAYRFTTGELRSWRLPQIALQGGEGQRRVAFGFSTHTAHRVFWIADRSVNSGKTGYLVETSSVYSTAF
jgi:hypothetical protein